MKKLLTSRRKFMRRSALAVAGFPFIARGQFMFSDPALGSLLNKRRAAAGVDMTGITHRWYLDEAVNDTRLDSIGSAHLADNNSVAQAAGVISSAAQFTAASSKYLSSGDIADLNPGSSNFAMAYWVKLTDNAADYGTIGKTENAVETLDWFAQIEHGSADKAILYIFDADSNAYFVKSDTFGAISSGSWHFVVCGREGSNLKLSVNAGAFDTSDVTGITVRNSGTGFYLGCNNPSGAFMNGSMDEVYWWPSMFPSQAIIEALYNGGSGAR